MPRVDLRRTDFASRCLPRSAFKPDGVIMFSDILTPLTGMNVPFDILEKEGPVVASPVRRRPASLCLCLRFATPLCLRLRLTKCVPARRRSARWTT